MLPTKRMILCAIILSLTFLSLLGLLLSRQLHIERWSKLMAITASTGFVMISVIGVYASRTIYSLLILIGLSFCWLGDLLGSNYFVLSVIAFLVAHLWFIVAFSFRGLQTKKILSASSLLVPVSSIIYIWLYPYLPSDHVPLVLGYVIIITVMVISSVGTLHRTGHTLRLVGALLFYISDIFVARWKYVSPSYINAFFCYPLYYASCISLAFSSLSNRNDRNEIGYFANSPSLP